MFTQRLFQVHAATLLLTSAPWLLGQATPETMPQRGLLPTGSYSLSDIETINNVNGNVLLQLPLTSLRPGRAGFSIGVNLTYNSQLYDLTLQPGTSVVSPGTPTLYQYLQNNNRGGGWQYGIGYGLHLDIRPSPTGFNCGGSADNWKIYRLSVVSPDGSHRTLHLYPHTPSIPAGQFYTDNSGDGYYEVDPAGAEASACSQARQATGDLTYHTRDGSFWKVVVSSAGGGHWANRQWTIYFPDGKMATGKGAQTEYLYDRNGNTISVANTAYYDPATSSWLLRTLVFGSSGPVIQISYNSFSPGNSTQDVISQSGYGGTEFRWTVNWSTIGSGSGLAYQCSQQNDYCQGNANQRVVSTVLLPTPQDGSSQFYQFGYAGNGVQGWGELNFLRLPTGAQVQYAYSLTGAYRTGFITENPISTKTLTWVDDTDPSPPRIETSTYTFGATSSQITNADGGVTTYSYFDPHGASDPRAGLVYKIQQPDSIATERVWHANRPYGSSALGNDAANPYIKHEFRTVSSGGLSECAAPTTFSYDKNGNRREVIEYGWIPCTSIARDPQGRPTGFTGGSILRTTTDVYHAATAVAGSGSETISNNANAYWYSGLPNRLWNLRDTTSTTGAGPGSSTKFLYANSPAVPNRIEEQRWNSQTGTWLSTLFGYDGYGNVTSIRNPRGYTTRLTYDANQCLTGKVIAEGMATARTFSYTCDFYSGRVKTETDSDHAITRTHDYDAFGRITMTTESGTGINRKRRTDYFDNARRIVTSTDVNTLGDFQRSQSSWYDQLGRTRFTTDNTRGSVITRHWTPAGGGFRYQVSSNPHYGLGAILFT